MSSDQKTTAQPPLDLSKWRKVPMLLVVGGAVLALIGFFVNRAEFAYSWLWAFMFYLSICLGSMFLVMMHHLFDAGWSVATRRFCEHIVTLLQWPMIVLFIPIAAMAPRIYPWMMEVKPATDHGLQAKQPVFTAAGFYIVAAACFAVWWLLANRLRFWSLEQDKDGAALPTYKMRKWSSVGIVAFALSLTAAVVMWMKALEVQWFSTMYGVYYFAGSVWLALGTVYAITAVLDRLGILTDVLHEHQYYFIGSLMFAFTVFHAYVTFAQYFIIWNGNIPEETYWYVIREQSGWWWVGLIIIFGHFFVPFLALLRIDVKTMFPYMFALVAWQWLMHAVDLSFNILPIPHPHGFPLVWLWLPIGCFAFMGGLLTMVFLKRFAAFAPYPLKDPRLVEAMGYYHPVPTQISGGELDQTDDLRAAPRSQGGHH